MNVYQMGQCMGMWPAHHSHPDQQRGHPSNIAGCCAKGKRRFWMVLILQFSVWTGHDTPHLHTTRGPELITCSQSTHETQGPEVWPFHISSYRGPEILGELPWWLPNQEVCCIWRWGMWSSESAFKYLDQEHSACRWQGSDSGLSRSSTQAFKH